LNDCKKTKADGSRLIPRKHTETLVPLSDAEESGPRNETGASNNRNFAEQFNHS